jgi:hypothetical protein
MEIEQPIALFSAEAFPLSAAILIDDDLKRGTAEKVQKTLEDPGGRDSARPTRCPCGASTKSPSKFRGFYRRQRCASHALKAHRPQQFVPRYRFRTMTSGPRVNTAALCRGR